MRAQTKLIMVYSVFFLSLSLLLLLGSWQWRRGVEKAAVEALLESAQSHQYTILDRAPQNWSELAYRRVRLHGDWRKESLFLLANRMHRGQVGYAVLSPFQLAHDGATLLVNRGWVESTAATNAHALTADLGLRAEVIVGGQLYLPQKGFTIGPTYVEPSRLQARGQPTWVKTIQYFDAAALSELLGVTLQPAVVALEAEHPDAFTPIWRAYTMPATRHFGYAVQWWGLAITLIVFGMLWRRSVGRSVGRSAARPAK